VWLALSRSDSQLGSATLTAFNSDEVLGNYWVSRVAECPFCNLAVSKVFTKHTRKVTDMLTRASHLSLLRGKSLHPISIKSVLIWPLQSSVLYSSLTPWSRNLEKLTGFQIVEKISAFYGNRWFISASTSARYLSLSWVRSIQSIPLQLTSLQLKFNIILPSTTGSPKWSLSLRCCFAPSKHLFEFFFARISEVC
jgi:hypothetical protein